MMKPIYRSPRQMAKCLSNGLLVMALMLFGSVAPALAQDDGFAPAAFVNSRVISQYELRQRVLFMTLLRQPGDIPKLALSSLVDDTLRRAEAKRLDVLVAPEDVQAAMTEFAGRAKLPLADFLTSLAQGGVAPETLRDFVESGLLWRGVIRAKFGGVTQISNAEIDRAIGAGAASGGEMRVLLSEIVLPTGGEMDAMAFAKRLKLTATTLPAFSMAAQNYSKAATAKAGGALGWAPISALPPTIAPQILALKVGEVTNPISVSGAVQLFYLRDISQASGDAKGPDMVSYAQFFAPDGTDLAAVMATLDTCDSLYEVAKGLPVESLQQATVVEASLPAGLRQAVSALDPGEAAIVPSLNGPATVVMLCSRIPPSAVAPSRDDVRTNLLNAKLGLLAGAYLEELRSNAIIKIQ